MSTFHYQARTPGGETRSGVVEASSQEAALEALHQRNLVVTQLREEKRPALLGGITFGTGVKQKDVVIFSRQLSTLLEARVPAVEALKTLLGETERTALKRIIAEILDDVAGGMALSQALGKHPRVFSGFYIHLVRSGEESGKLQEVFSYLADYLERSYYLASKARNSLIYPAFILFAFVGVLVVMLVAVIPRLVTIFEETGQAVPFYTQVVIFVSSFLRQWGLAVLLAAIGAAIAIWRWSMTPGGKWFFHKLQLHTPILGNLYQKLFMARLTDNLKTLFLGGIPILRALAISGDVVGNVVYQRAVAEAIESVKAGNTISAAFERTREIPVLVTQMIRIGEASGRLDFILGNVAKFYQREVDTAFENLVALIEPFLIIFLGAGIGILVGSVLVPLYNLVGTF